jgi:hypothetical protein
MREHKLKSCINSQGTLKWKGIKQGLGVLSSIWCCDLPDGKKLEPSVILYMKVQRNIFLRSLLCQSDISYIALKNIEMVHHYLIISYLISMFDATGTSRTVEVNCSCTFRLKIHVVYDCQETINLQHWL